MIVEHSRRPALAWASGGTQFPKGACASAGASEESTLQSTATTLFRMFLAGLHLLIMLLVALLLDLTKNADFRARILLPLILLVVLLGSFCTGSILELTLKGWHVAGGPGTRRECTSLMLLSVVCDFNCDRCHGLIQRCRFVGALGLRLRSLQVEARLLLKQLNLLCLSGCCFLRHLYSLTLPFLLLFF